ncbi:hypothetical protein GWI33_002218 [Rhynchophorus ferrugineus]|uniref:Uncharacterized protein n=1 Tax=Rhynchophorus ferrugineus TaxID=354439 RepID=A0A834M385_RHYFE|nr:hypothetical protein GWI33_002218 [Rhynchophorus ferrugineus]
MKISYDGGRGQEESDDLFGEDALRPARERRDCETNFLRKCHGPLPSMLIVAGPISAQREICANVRNAKRVRGPSEKLPLRRETAPLCACLNFWQS